MTDYTIASPNGGTWSIQSANTAKTGRYHDLMFVQEGAAGPGNVFSKARTGIFAGPPGATLTQSPGAGAVTVTSGFGWQVTPYCAVVERSSLVGPYFVQSTAVGTGSVATPDPSQTRVDRIDTQVFDGALGDNGGVSLTRVHVTQGTPGAGIPTAPTGTTPHGWWTLPAGATSLTQGMWTPARRSTGIRGAVRFLLEGDSLSDPGFDAGEQRDTALFSVAAGGGTIDRWNPSLATPAWELLTPLPGLHDVEYSFSGQSVLTNTPTLVGWSTLTKTSPDITLTTGNTIPQSVLTFNRGGEWLVSIAVDCNPPTDNTKFTAFRFRAPNDTGTIKLGSGGNTLISDSAPFHVDANTAFGVILVQQTGSTQSVGGRFRASLLHG